jgi:hypothetical protein
MNFFFKNILGTDKLKLEKYTEYIGNLTKEKVKLEELQKKYPDIAWINQEKENLRAFIEKSNKPQESSHVTELEDEKTTTPDSATSALKTSASETPKSKLETPDSPDAQTTGGTRKKRKNKKRKKHKKKTFKY